jgi:hypothetical protein
VARDAGGSGIDPASVRVTGRSGRYIPVRLKANGRRTFRVRLYRRNGKRAISSIKVTVPRKGVRLAKLPLPATAGPGRYRVVVQVFKGKRRVGRQVRVAIVVA